MHNPCLSRSHLYRAKFLLDVDYTPRELAEALGAHKATITKHWIPAGLPHQRFSNRRIFVNGREFQNWANSLKPDRSIGPNEAFCLSCRLPQQLVSPKVEVHPKVTLLTAPCPVCGKTLNRFVKRNHSQ